MSNMPFVLVGGLIIGALKFGYGQWEARHENEFADLISRYETDAGSVTRYLAPAVAHCTEEWLGSPAPDAFDRVMVGYMRFTLKDYAYGTTDGELAALERQVQSLVRQFDGQLDGPAADGVERLMYSLENDYRFEGCVGRLVNAWNGTA